MILDTRKPPSSCTRGLSILRALEGYRNVTICNVINHVSVFATVLHKMFGTKISPLAGVNNGTIYDSARITIRHITRSY
jgi:hypothetical protein